MTYHCPYCNWQKEEPNIAEYEDSPMGRDAYEDAMREFEHDQKNHKCKGGNMSTLAEKHNKTTQDYIYCEDCQTFADFWKYDHDINNAGHEGCHWRYVTPEELEECFENCEEEYARCPKCDALVDGELDNNETECGSCGCPINKGNVKWVNCFTDG